LFAVPRGGVPLGYEIARNLQLPLDVVLSKKIGHPFKKEFGAVSLDSTLVDVHPDVPKEYVEKKLSDSEIYCVKNTSSTEAIEST
jgi:predicted phosphoribosyltransferase